MKSWKILVASHQEAFLRNLKDPFLEVAVVSDGVTPFGYRAYTNAHINKLRFPSAWSEVVVMLEIRKFISDNEIVGLQHYRRFFSYNEVRSSDHFELPFVSRNLVVEGQIDKMKEYEDKVVVPQRWECGKSTWDQFMESHPNLECLMEFSTARLSEALFDVFGPIDTLAVLKQTRFLHPYNMFVGNRSFYQEWVNVLDKLIPAIEDEAARMIDKLGVRWGGYIMERLFPRICTCVEFMLVGI